MIFFYIRHGDPVYNPDSLTELGEKQAKALAKRLALYGVDKVFCSTSNRAIMTAQPTCDLLNKEMTLMDFCNEKYGWDELTLRTEDNRMWLFQCEHTRLLFTDDSIRKLGNAWYRHPEFKDYNFKKGIERVYNDTDKFFLSLGYEHERYTGRYKVVKPNNDRIALFAHQGFGISFLSCLLDIPYPQFSMHFDICHSGMTVIEFKEVDGYTVPKVLTLSSDSHIYKEGLPTDYNHMIEF